MQRQALEAYLKDYLQIDRFKDYAPNGLQVEGRDEIRTIVTGVTACQALIDRAIELGADALLVHHGFFWKNEPATIVGMKQRRIKALLAHDISLFGYHLPLDGHSVIGNNARLGEVIGFDNVRIVEQVPQNLLWRAELTVPVTPAQFMARITERLGREPIHLAAEKTQISSVAWCTGGAQDYIDTAYELGVDAFISGEASERTFHSAVEQNVHYFAAGHHATERYGIEALGKHLADKFGLLHHFVDIDNPI
ncbi:Nif3-like dinuclear metal center hexameric protein [Shewanella sp. A3A]|uniref:Nif3-like dinuclear metal center hexameric protein n=1 Tax=Shewanella electrica TaxID=515560 RepID=A0ABT2FJX3_9GAMM|nr:Nif3-like dinuclear metal center hexameric protein [Shewanella electrica]MCH1918920.1 Nif3-like dinuclear metal center hexameric protein [Shewanella ferrihydritica]MCH1924921.1 Nif3-like dinuclear metal center hexameric protein [Shewanella electrica]MCS4556634.1 Nif3-like dinuclear metal center hexameric protein [Shewanella electrica]